MDRTADEILAEWGFKREGDIFIRREGDMTEVIDMETVAYPYRYYDDRPQYLEPLELNSDFVRAMYLYFKDKGRYDDLKPKSEHEYWRDLLGVETGPTFVVTLGENEEEE